MLRMKEDNRIAETTAVEEQRIDMTGAVDEEYINKTTNTTQRTLTKKPPWWILLWYKKGRKNYMKAKDYLRA